MVVLESFVVTERILEFGMLEVRARTTTEAGSVSLLIPQEILMQSLLAHGQLPETPLSLMTLIGLAEG